MEQDFITCSEVCSFAPHSHAAVKTTPHLCFSKRNRSTPVRRQLSLTHVGLEKLNCGGVRLTPLINVWSREAFFRYSMLHLCSAHHATLAPDGAGMFSSSSVAGLNEWLDLSCRSCPPSGDRSLLYKRCSAS